MALFEKKDKEKKEKVKKEKVKKEKVKKEKVKIKSETVPENNEEATTLKPSSKISARQAFKIIFGVIAGSFMCISFGVLMGVLLLKPGTTEDAAKESVSQASSVSAGAMSANTSLLSRLRAENTAQGNEVALSDFDGSDEVSADLSDDISPPEPLTADSSEHAQDNQGDAQETVESKIPAAYEAPPVKPVKPAQSSPARTTKPASSSVASPGLPPEESEYVPHPVPEPTYSAPSVKSEHLTAYVNTFEQSSQMLAGVSSDSDVAVLGELYESMNSNASELFDYAAQGQANGLSESEINSAYELSSAYSILGDGIHYAARVLENGELFDTELIRMTNESAREKFDSAFNGQTVR